MKELNLDKSKSYLLACSYGPDSMALFFLLNKSGYDFDCAIVNYHIRNESNQEVEGLKKYAKEHNIKVYVHECDKDSKKSEAKCREIRYSFFRELFDKNGYDALLVAHHQDDKIETYLMQKERQNSPKIFGIAEKTEIKHMLVVRPLLSYTKKELENICVSNHVPFAIDKTNFDTSILRNKIRHEIVARMSEEERQKILEEIDRENAELDKMSKSVDLGKIHSCSYLLSLDDKTLCYSLNLMIKCIRDDLYLSNKNVGEIKKVLLSKNPNVVTKLKSTYFFIKEYDFVDIIKDDLMPIDYKYILTEPDRLDTPYFYLDFTKDSSNRNVYPFNYPLTIRNVRLDDFVYIKGYKVLVRRLMIDWKIPLRLRMRWPIILDHNDEPLYIPRYQKDFVPDSKCNFYVK